jgi:hypothetical protein
MNEAQISRLAHALNELRPDWPIASLTTWIRNHLATRAFRDAAVACTWVALDMQADGSWTSRTLARVLEAGPWWRAAAAGEDGIRTSRNPRPDEACPDCGGFAGSCPCGRPVPTRPRPDKPGDGTKALEQMRDRISAAKGRR